MDNQAWLDPTTAPTAALAWRAPPLPAVPYPSLLHLQLQGLAALATPSAEDTRTRAKVLSRVTRVVQHSLGRAAHVTLFGSSSTDLALPTSDIDVSVAVSDCSSSMVALSSVDEHCRRKRGLSADGVDFIRGAKVPIVNFEEARSGLEVDISADAPDTLRGREATRTALTATPSLRPLLLALKLALAQRGLNKPRFGGIGSYLLFVMVRVALSGRGGDLDLGTLLQHVAAHYAHAAAYRPRLDLVDPTNGQECGGAAWAWPRIGQVVTEWSRGLAAHGCLSSMIRGWPPGGLLATAAQLRALCAIRPPRAPRAHRGSPSPRRGRSSRSPTPDRRVHVTSLMRSRSPSSGDSDSDDDSGQRSRKRSRHEVGGALGRVQHTCGPSVNAHL